MSVQRTLQKYMDDWKRISHFDFCLLQEDNSILVTTCDRRLPAESKLEEFRNSTALCLSNATCCLYKITEKNEQLLLIVWGSEDSVSTIGELAVCQIESILESYAEKNDKNAFMQKLLLGDYTDVEAFNRARKLHISSSARRAVFLVETRQSKDEHALATIKNIFSARTHDFITSIDNRGIIVVRELTSAETYDDLENIAHMLVDMLGTEAMTQAWVAYSNTANDLKDLSNAYKEARTALEIGKIIRHSFPEDSSRGPRWQEQLSQNPRCFFWMSRFLQLMRFSANLCRWRSGEFRGRQILRPFLLLMIRMRQWSCRI